MKRTWMSGLIVVCGLLLPLVPALAACGPTTPAPSAVAVQVHLTATPEPSVPLEGTEWELTALLGTTDVPIYPSWALTFNRGNSMEATCGCRRYVADYTTSGSEFRMGEVHTAESGCQPHDRPGEMFAEALAGITAYHASEERLAFYNAAGEAILVYARDLPVAVDSALAGMWLLESLNGRGLVADSLITLDLLGEGFEGNAGCNEYWGELAAADGGMWHTGVVFSHLLLCPGPAGIMGQEDAFTDALRSAAAYRVTDGRLEIVDAGGKTVLVFTRQQ